MKRNNSKYTYGRTCVYNINYHIIWGAKYRRKWMTAGLEDEIKQILHDIARENGFSIEHIEIGLDDHIHLLVAAPPKLSVTVIVKWSERDKLFQTVPATPGTKKSLLEYQ